MELNGRRLCYIFEDKYCTREQFCMAETVEMNLYDLEVFDQSIFLCDWSTLF